MKKKKKQIDLSAENINRFIDKFTEIYGDAAAPIPDKRRVTVWCSNGMHISGFAVNVNTSTIGLNALIAQRWILHTELVQLIVNEKR